MLRISGLLDEFQNTIDGGERVIESGLVVEPVPRAAALSNVETVDAAWQRMDVQYDVHSVSCDGVIRDILEVLELIAMV